MDSSFAYLKFLVAIWAVKAKHCYIVSKINAVKTASNVCPYYAVLSIAYVHGSATYWCGMVGVDCG
jgi:hypothetical protein